MAKSSQNLPHIKTLKMIEKTVAPLFNTFCFSTQVAQIVGPLLANCGNRWQMVGWHANNEPTQAEQL